MTSSCGKYHGPLLLLGVQGLFVAQLYVSAPSSGAFAVVVVIVVVVVVTAVKAIKCENNNICLFEEYSKCFSII